MATEQSNIEALGADRARLYTPVAETDRRAEARAIAEGIATIGETGLRVDAMRQQGKFQRELEATRKAAEIAGKAYDQFGAIPAEVRRRGITDPAQAAKESEMLGIFAEVDAMSEAESEGVADVIRDTYGEMGNLAAAYKAGHLSGSAFELRISNLYRAASQRRPGYRDQFRQMAAQFLGTDIESTINQRLFDFGKPEKGGNDIGKYREWLIDNVAQSPDDVAAYLSMSESEAAMLAGPQMSQEAALQRSVNLMEHYTKDTTIYNQKFLTTGKTHISGQLDGLLQGSLAEVHRMSKELPADEYAKWYGENAGRLTASIDQIRANPRAFTESFLRRIERANPEFDRSRVLPETLDALDREAVDRAERILPMLTDPSFGKILAAANTAMLSSSEFDMYRMSDALVRLRAMVGPEAFGGMMGTLTTRYASDKLFDPNNMSSGIGPWLINGANDPTTEELNALSSLATYGTMDAIHAALFGDDLGDVVTRTGEGAREALPTLEAGGVTDFQATTLLTAGTTLVDAGLRSTTPEDTERSAAGVRNLANQTLNLFESGEFSNKAASDALSLLNSAKTRELEEKSGVSFAEERQRIADITINNVGKAMQDAKAERGGIFSGMMTGLLAVIGAPMGRREFTYVNEDGSSEVRTISDDYVVTLNLRDGGMVVAPNRTTYEQMAARSGPGASPSLIRENVGAFNASGATSPFASVPKSTSNLMGHAIVTTLDDARSRLSTSLSINESVRGRLSDRDYFNKALFNPNAVDTADHLVAVSAAVLNTPIAQFLVPDAVTVTPNEIPDFARTVFSSDGRLKPLYSEGFIDSARESLTKSTGNAATAEAIIEATRWLSREPGAIRVMKGHTAGNQPPSQQDVIDFANILLTTGAIKRGIIKAN